MLDVPSLSKGFYDVSLLYGLNMILSLKELYIEYLVPLQTVVRCGDFKKWLDHEETAFPDGLNHYWVRF